MVEFFLLTFYTVRIMVPKIIREYIESHSTSNAVNNILMDVVSSNKTNIRSPLGILKV